MASNPDAPKPAPEPDTAFPPTKGPPPPEPQGPPQEAE